MPIAVNDIIQVTLEADFWGSRILNTFHYRCLSAPPAGPTSGSLASLLAYLWDQATGIMSLKWGPVNNTSYFLRRAKGQVLTPIRSAYVNFDIGGTGAIVPDGLQVSNLSWVITRKTDLGGRAFRGNLHLVVPTAGWTTNSGFLSGANRVDREALRDQIPLQVSVPIGGQYEPVIFHRNLDPNYTRITTAVIQDEVRTMSRRTVGRGI
jgi:hypothetical protein